jgi:hypothetical protein
MAALGLLGLVESGDIALERPRDAYELIHAVGDLTDLTVLVAFQPELKPGFHRSQVAPIIFHRCGEAERDVPVIVTERRSFI